MRIPDFLVVAKPAKDPPPLTKEERQKEISNIKEKKNAPPHVEVPKTRTKSAG